MAGMFRSSALLIAIGLLVTGCASVPTGPSVMALPGAGKNFEQFQTDNAACRDWAGQQAGVGTKQASTGSTVTGAAVGTVLGAAVGAALGAAARSPATGAAVGAGVGLLGGTAVGAGQGAAAAESVQRRYDAAYTQCMYAKGNQVPAAGTVRPSYTQPMATAPPPPPPPAGSTPPAPPPPSPPAANVPPPPVGPPPPPPPAGQPTR
jgi:Glycine-zipper domain